MRLVQCCRSKFRWLIDLVDSGLRKLRSVEFKTHYHWFLCAILILLVTIFIKPGAWGPMVEDVLNLRSPPPGRFQSLKISTYVRICSVTCFETNGHIFTAPNPCCLVLPINWKQRFKPQMFIVILWMSKGIIRKLRNLRLAYFYLSCGSAEYSKKKIML